MRLKVILFGIGAILPLLFLTFILYFYITTRYFKKVILKNQQNCKRRLDYHLSVEDLELFHQNYLIGGASNIIQLMEGDGINHVPNGELVYVKLDSKDMKIQKMDIIGFPANIKFQPHGIFLDKRIDLLYAISHSFTMGGQRVEVFLIEDLGQIKTLFNDLIVHNGYMYLTQYLPQPQPIEGFDKSLIARLRKIFGVLTGKRGKNIEKCKIIGQKLKPQFEGCQSHVSGVMIMPNGITSDPKTNRVWVADFLNSKVHRFEIQGANGDLKWKEHIDLDFSVDNMQYIEESDSLLVASAPKLIEFINFTKAFEERKHEGMFVTSGGAEIFNNDGKLEKVKELFMQTNHSGISAVKRWKDAQSKTFYFVGSWHHRGIRVCEF